MAQSRQPKKIIMWALTYDCNASCEYCYLKDYVKPHKELNKTDCFKIAEKIVENENWRPQAIWLTGGEPTILSFLPELVRYFQQNGIQCVINTNGIIDDVKLDSLLNSEPKGLVVSIDAVSHKTESLKRSYSYDDLKAKIAKIASNKKNYTILGAATVISKYNIGGLDEYAKEMQEIGVDYISLNPMHGEENDDLNATADCLKKQLTDIKRFLRIKLPDNLYLEMISNLYGVTNDNDFEVLCPALEDYFFISPWGYIYPCSNEGWQKFDSLKFNLLNSKDWYLDIQNITSTVGWKRSTKSNCFGDRCVGCFKLYYDTVFTGDDF